MAYHNMNQTYNKVATVVIYIIEMLVAIAVTDIGIIFQFGAALAGSSAQFIWPGYFFIHAEYKYGSRSDWKSRIFTRTMALFYFFSGVCLLFGLLGGTFYNIFKNSEEGGKHH